ncbi:hypothetical protein ACQY0O_008058 [Thecaphora frezii]
MALNVPSHLLSSGERKRGQGSLAHSSSLGSFGGSGSRNGGLGSRHGSHSTLNEDAIHDWLSMSGAAALDRMPATPTGQCDDDAFIIHDHMGPGIGLVDDVDSPAVRWNEILGAMGGDVGIGKGWGGANLELQANGLIANLQVDDLFNDNASSASSNYGGGAGDGTIHLPGWNHGPDLNFGPLDSDADSPENVWGVQGSIPLKTLRRSAKLIGQASVDALQECYGSPGAGLGLAVSPPAASPSLLAAPQPLRALRQCISAPELQRDEVFMGSSDLLADAGFAGFVKAPAGAFSCMTSSADLLGGAESASRARTGGMQGGLAINITLATSGTSQGTQPSALLQRRAVQREGQMPVPVPVAVDTAQAQAQRPPNVATAADAEGQGQRQNADQDRDEDQGGSQVEQRNLDIPLSELTAEDLESMTEEQRLRLAQVHQLQFVQQAARLGVYTDFVAPSQQFAGQEASERAAKAVQAALLYGMEGNGPRRLSVGSTGLPTPITPQHPLNPAPVSEGYGYGFGVGGPDPFGAQQYRMGTNAALGGRMPGMPMSAIETSFPPSVYQVQPHMHHQHHPAMFASPYYTPELGGGAFLDHQATHPNMAGYTSTYPPRRPDPFSATGGVSDGAAGEAGPSYSQAPMAAGLVVGGSGGDAMFSRDPPRSAPPNLANEIFANPMHLHLPYATIPSDAPQAQAQAQGMTAGGGAVPELTRVELHQPVAQRPLLAQYRSLSSGFSPMLPQDGAAEVSQAEAQAQAEPRSAPATMGGQATMKLQQQQAAEPGRGQAGEDEATKLRRKLHSQASMPAMTTRKHQPGQLSAPLSPPRSPMKMKSSPQLRDSGSPPTPAAAAAGKSSTSPSIRKIASNRRINTAASSSSSPSMTAGAAKAAIRSKSTIFAQPQRSPATSTRTRTTSHISAKSHASTSKSPTPAPHSSGGGFALSFVNYGMDDAEELCSAVAPSGSYKVPLKGYGSSGSESRSDDDDDDDEDEVEGSPKKPRRDREREVSRATSTASLSKRRARERSTSLVSRK